MFNISAVENQVKEQWLQTFVFFKMCFSSSLDISSVLWFAQECARIFFQSGY